ncbi:CBU_0592 family membrane protein [Glycomyces tarimensis]
MPDFDLRMVLQISGALLCVVNYLLIQTRRITATQPVSLLIVACGGVILLASAIMGADWGLIILEVSWLVMVTVTLVIRHREALASAAAADTSTMVPANAAALTTTGELELVS